MVYELELVGGPSDGEVSLSPRPYEAIRQADGHVYRAEDVGDGCLIWVDDDTRRIVLHHQGIGAEFPTE
jgi:hypothetical protein